MASGAAKIGSIHVSLGLDSAAFQAGLAKAQSGLGKFAKAAKIGFAAVAVAAAAAGTALAFAVKGSIDRADGLSKAAQRIGVTTEALSRLEWAAKLSDVSLEQLSTGMQRLSRNMLDVSNGGGKQAATAFKALGISVTDASGKLRSSDEVFADIADRFSRMPDGAEKTALAMQLLGKSGAEMIPLLNSGKDGLKAMAEESDRLGNTLSTKTGRAAEAFNDSITRLQAGVAGMVNKIAEAALPTLNSLIETLTSPGFMAAMQDFAIAAIATAEAIAQVFIGAHKAFKDFMEFIGASGGEGPGAQYDERGMWETWRTSEDGVRAASEINRTIDWQRTGRGGMPSVEDLYAGFGFNSDGTIKIQETASAVDQLRAVFETLGAGAGGAAKVNKELNAIIAEGKSVFTATRTPAEAYSLEIERLNTLLQKGAIDQDTYNRAVVQAQDAFQQAEFSGNQLAQSLSTGLATMFSNVVSGSKSAVEAVGDLLKSLGDMLIHQGFQALIGGMFGGGGGLGSIFGGLFGGGGGGLKLGFNGIPGFDAGGHTGFGARAGGLDGKGGFLAMLHPDETVLDHTRGQGGGTVTIQISGSKQDAAAIAREVRRVLPDALNDANRNPYRRQS